MVDFLDKGTTHHSCRRTNLLAGASIPKTALVTAIALLYGCGSGGNLNSTLQPAAATESDFQSASEPVSGDVADSDADDSLINPFSPETPASALSEEATPEETSDVAVEVIAVDEPDTESDIGATVEEISPEQDSEPDALEQPVEVEEIEDTDAETIPEDTEQDVPLPIEETPPEEAPAVEEPPEQEPPEQEPLEEPVSEPTVTIIGLPVADLPVGVPVETGILQDEVLREISGLTTSKRYSNVLWMHNDSGGEPEIYALNSTGETLATYRLDARASDWEDMSSVVIGGVPYLMVGDIGDNNRRKDEYRIYLFEEPDVSQYDPLNNEMAVATITYQYPVQSYNSEAFSTDGEWIYIITKSSQVLENDLENQLFRIPLLLNPGDDVLLAEHMGTLPERGLKLVDSVLQPNSGVPIRRSTAFEIQPNGNVAYMLTYSNVFKIDRSENQSWSDAILTAGISIQQHSLRQGEALTVGEDGTVWYTSEGVNAPLIALKPE